MFHLGEFVSVGDVRMCPILDLFHGDGESSFSAINLGIWLEHTCQDKREATPILRTNLKEYKP